jgi:alpha-glucosidase
MPSTSLSLPAGAITEWKKSPTGISGKTSNGLFKLEFYSESTVRVVNTRQDSFNDFSYAVIASPLSLSFEVTENGSHIELTTRSLKVVVNKASFSISFHTPTGDIINEDDPLGTRWKAPVGMAGRLRTIKNCRKASGSLALEKRTAPSTVRAAVM